MWKIFRINTYNLETDIRFIKPFIWLSNVTALMPPVHFERRASTWRQFYRVYCVLVAVAIAAVTGYSFYYRINFVDPNVKGSIAVLYHLRSFFLLLSTITIIMYVPFRHGDNYQAMFHNIFKFDRQLNLPPKRRYNMLYMSLLGGFTYMTLFTVADKYNWYQINNDDDITFIIDKTEIFHLVLFLIFLKQLVNVFRHRFINLNGLLVKIIERTMLYNNKDKNMMNKIVFVLLSDNNHIEEVGKLYGLLCDQIKLFNDMFGIAILHAMNTIVIDLLVTINMILLYSSNQIYSAPDKENINYSLLVILICWTCTLLFLAITIASACQETVREAKRSYAICMRYFYKFPTVPENKTDGQLRDSLLVLSQQIASRIPRFSAGGFFDVDHTMLFSFLTQITTYLVALIQFNNIA